MSTNVGKIDRIIRVAIGLAIISQVFIGLHTLWGWIGIIPLLTGLLGWCGLYTVLGIRTCPLKKQS